MRNISTHIVSHFIVLVSLSFGCSEPTVKLPLPLPAPTEDSFLPCKAADFWYAVRVAESNDNPRSVYMEPAPLNYESIGVYQLSPEDSARYSGCSKLRADYFDREKSEQCKDSIVAKLRRLYPTLSWSLALGKYWSVMRGPEWGSKMRASGWNRLKTAAASRGCVIK